MFVPTLYSVQKHETPQHQRLMVGEDIMPIHKPSPAKEKWTSVAFQDVSEFSHQAGRARDNWLPSSLSNANSTIELTKNKDTELVTVTVRSNKTQEVQASFVLDDDVRLSWDADGAVMVSKGTRDDDGVLRAHGNDDILLRVHADAVDGGEGNATIVNVSGKKGTFTGGKGNTQFFGMYSNSVITGGSGTNSFFGVYENSKVDGGDARNTFSGYFFGSAVSGGKGSDSFTGWFLGQSTLNGNAGNDKFSGRFSDSTINGGTGHNVYGGDAKIIRDPGNEKFKLQIQFNNTTINGSDEGDVFQGYFYESRLNGGKKEDTFKGFFDKSHVRGGAGDDSFFAVFANATTFLGEDGDDAIDINIDRNTVIDGGVGDNSIGMGKALKGQRGWAVNLSVDETLAEDKQVVKPGDEDISFDLLDRDIVYSGAGSPIAGDDHPDNPEGYTKGSGKGAFIKVTQHDTVSISFRSVQKRIGDYGFENARAASEHKEKTRPPEYKLLMMI